MYKNSKNMKITKFLLSYNMLVYIVFCMLTYIFNLIQVEHISFFQNSIILYIILGSSITIYNSVYEEEFSYRIETQRSLCGASGWFLITVSLIKLLN
jgi:hypothetical protein